jgi:hydroxymethylbilane synthase
LAVHSMKDVPTALPSGLTVAAVLPRANPMDILIHKGLDFLQTAGVVATGSLRRRAQWLARYPDHRTENLRGNVNTRLKKLEESDWNGAIFAAAGLERLKLVPETYIPLPWMIPAPAQGAMVVVVREADVQTLDAVRALNDSETANCVSAERSFLRTLEGGCTAPIGALAKVENGTIVFKGGLFALDGSQSFLVEKTCSTSDDPWAFGALCAEEVLGSGGADLMAQIRKSLS